MNVVIVTDEDIDARMQERASFLGELMDTVLIENLVRSRTLPHRSDSQNYVTFAVNNVAEIYNFIIDEAHSRQRLNDRQFNLQGWKVNESLIKIVHYDLEATFICLELHEYDDPEFGSDMFTFNLLSVGTGDYQS